MLIPILTTLALAELSAREDAWQIRRNLIIDHVMQWYIRAVVVLGVCWVCGVPWLSIGLAGLFSAVFRLRLNRLRGKDWRYVSFSNWYDTMFLNMTRSVYAAGTIAYIFEGLVFAGVLGWHLI